MAPSSRALAWSGAALMLGVSMLSFGDLAAAEPVVTAGGAVVLAIALGAFFAARSIARGSRVWGWRSGLAVAIGSLVVYLLRRKTGLLPLPSDMVPGFWRVCLTGSLLDAAFAVLAVVALAAPWAGATRLPRWVLRATARPEPAVRLPWRWLHANQPATLRRRDEPRVR